MKPGDLVKINCSNNRFLNGKTGILLLNDDDHSYGTCVMIEGVVYGFLRHEVKNTKNDETCAENPYL